MTLPVQIFNDHDIPETYVRGFLQLEHLVWPSEKTVEQHVANFYKGLGTRPSTERHLRYMIIENEQVIAHAETFVRVMFTEEGAIGVMALGGVCTDLNQRGRGLGAAIVRAAFTRVDDGTFPVSVFQTPVDEFYAKLGSAVCQDNRWVDKANQQQPEAHPWEPGEKLMYYPASYNWPSGVIDINGGMY